MLLLIVVQKIVGCTALNRNLPELLLLAGFNSDSFGCSETEFQVEEQIMKKKLRSL